VSRFEACRGVVVGSFLCSDQVNHGARVQLIGQANAVRVITGPGLRLTPGTEVVVTDRHGAWALMLNEGEIADPEAAAHG